jgi:membrane-associated phospholipid phosphatase
MKKQKTWVATFLLLILPLSLFAQGPMSGETKSDPARNISLSMPSAPAAPTVSALAVPSAFSQSTPAAAPWSLSFRSVTSDFLKDAGEIWSYPVHIQTRDILPIASLALVTGFLIANDEAIHRGFIQYRMNNAWVKAVSPALTQMGSYGSWAIAAAFLLFGRQGSKSLETGILATSAILQCGILTTFLKGMFGRQRPFWDNGVDRWSGPVGFFSRFGSGQLGRYDSFPGGHSITAFSLATVLAMQYRESVWVPILSYAMAGGVALSRVTENKHWLSDCLVGGFLGVVIGRMVVVNHRNRYHILPTAGVDHGSLSFALTVSNR